jgi:hypothetical protein
MLENNLFLSQNIRFSAMQQVILNVREDNLLFLSELLSNFDFVEIVKPDILAKPKKKKYSKSQQAFVDDLKESILEMELHKAGKIKLTNSEEILSQL